MTKTNCSKIIRGIAVLWLCLPLMARAQQPVIPLYSGVAPGSENAQQKEAETLAPGNQKRVRNITQPTLTAYLPERDKANGTAVIIAPGGGFMFLSIDMEGHDVARWLRARGVAAFVLKYRVMDTGTEEEYQKQVAGLMRAMQASATAPAPPAPPAPNPARQKVVELAVTDGEQAVKLVRQRAAEWGIAPDRVGLLGFSAGGMVTMGVVMKNDAASRPNFAAPIYGGSVNGQAVAADAPPLFITVANDDPASVGSAKLYLEWKAAKRPAELHIYAKGGHGFGMNKRGLPVDSWIDRFGEWLEAQGLLKKP